jgi:PAS domain S-box-containing protein/putative nucleotidyltransferase with HDIG domain
LQDEGIGVSTAARSDLTRVGCQGIIEALTAPVFAVDREFRYTAFNGAHAAAMLDSQGAKIEVGHRLLDYYSVPIEGERVRANLERALGGQTVVCESWTGQEGSRRFHWTTHSPIRGGAEIVGVAMVSADLTDTELISQSQARLATIVESSKDAIVSVLLDGAVLTWNSGAEQMYGYPAGEMIGQDFWQLVPAEEREHARKQFARAARDERVEPYETAGLAKDGRRISIWITLSPFRGPDGRVIGTSSIGRDTTRLLETEAALTSSNAALTQMVDDILEAVGKIVEFRDPYTQGHERGVAALGQALARRMGLTESDAEAIEVAGLMHDIGKLAIPSEILSKPGALSDAEHMLIKAHVQAGYEILSSIAFPWPVAEIVLEHHERADGSGYPRGLLAKDTLLAARVLAVADVVEAMAYHRPYRPALGADAAIAEISGHPELYDPDVSAACVGLFEAGLLPF